MTTNLQEAYLEPPSGLQADPNSRFQVEPEQPRYDTRPAALRKSWREQRAERRRRRIWLEEMLAWILVPLIVIGTYWSVDAGLAALGTSPTAIINGINAIIAAL